MSIYLSLTLSIHIYIYMFCLYSTFNHFMFRDTICGVTERRKYLANFSKKKLCKSFYRILIIITLFLKLGVERLSNITTLSEFEN